ncbi:hypothetical protein FQR65_LT20203 [Abscondita terminalis]|nr:hypothetical protein FQR65_LT20203 [Abscondita terminalis]
MAIGTLISAGLDSPPIPEAARDMGGGVAKSSACSCAPALEALLGVRWEHGWACRGLGCLIACSNSLDLGKSAALACVLRADLLCLLYLGNSLDCCWRASHIQSQAFFGLCWFKSRSFAFLSVSFLSRHWTASSRQHVAGQVSTLLVVLIHIRAGRIALGECCVGTPHRKARRGLHPSLGPAWATRERFDRVRSRAKGVRAGWCSERQRLQPFGVDTDGGINFSGVPECPSGRVPVPEWRWTNVTKMQNGCGVGGLDSHIRRSCLGSKFRSSASAHGPRAHICGPRERRLYKMQTRAWVPMDGGALSFPISETKMVVTRGLAVPPLKEKTQTKECGQEITNLVGVANGSRAHAHPVASLWAVGPARQFATARAASRHGTSLGPWMQACSVGAPATEIEMPSKKPEFARLALIAQAIHAVRPPVAYQCQEYWRLGSTQAKAAGSTRTMGQMAQVTKIGRSPQGILSWMQPILVERARRDHRWRMGAPNLRGKAQALRTARFVRAARADRGAKGVGLSSR